MGSGLKERISLYVRLPVKIIDEHQILQLHPKISIVHLPRQKSRRWCTLDFSNRSDQEEVRLALKKTKIEDKRIIVKPFKYPKQHNKKISKGCQDLKELLPTV